MTYNVFDGTLNPILPIVCLSVCPQHNQKTNDPKVFKLCVGNDLGYPQVIWFWIERSKVKLRVNRQQYSMSTL